MRAVLWSFSFLVLNIIALQVVVLFKRKSDGPQDKARSLEQPTREVQLGAEHILEWEHEYIRRTASEAMQDRHAMINFYLVLVGVVASGVLANLKELDKWEGGATLLLWAVCSVGWCHFLILVRLREAWYESMLAMAQLREFCIQHAQGFSPAELMTAFRWRKETIPSADKPWSVFFYSALLIGLLDSLAFGVGGHLLNLGWKGVNLSSTILLVGLSIAFFACHILMYFELLKKP